MCIFDKKYIFSADAFKPEERKKENGLFRNSHEIESSLRWIFFNLVILKKIRNKSNRNLFLRSVHLNRVSMVDTINKEVTSYALA